MSAGEDAMWSLSDVNIGEAIVSVKSESGISSLTLGYTAAEIHPDGLILGTGSEDACVRLWDLKSRVVAAEFTGHTGPISSLNFSENGYHLCTTSSTDALVKFWDLRKLSEFYSLPITLNGDGTGVARARFDQSGKYVGVAYDQCVRYFFKTDLVFIRSRSGRRLRFMNIMERG